jgi:hypothetical protein
MAEDDALRRLLWDCERWLAGALGCDDEEVNGIADWIEFLSGTRRSALDVAAADLVKAIEGARRVLARERRNGRHGSPEMEAAREPLRAWLALATAIELPAPVLQAVTDKPGDDAASARRRVVEMNARGDFHKLKSGEPLGAGDLAHLSLLVHRKLPPKPTDARRNPPSTADYVRAETRAIAQVAKRAGYTLPK